MGAAHLGMGLGQPGAAQLGAGLGGQLGAAQLSAGLGGQLGATQHGAGLGGPLGAAQFVALGQGSQMPSHIGQHPTYGSVLGLGQQPQNWYNVAQPQPQVPQIPPNILSALSQLPAGAASSAIQSLIQNVHQVQQPGMSLPVPGNQHVQQQIPGLGNLLQQAPVYANPPVLGAAQGNHQGLQYGQHQVPQQKPTTMQGMSSMTGVTHIRPTEFSKHCQVEYAKKIKPDNCNLVLYIWGYVAQLLLSRQGHVTGMSDQEQNGRLQHLLHMLELCATQSSSTDFNSQPWLCAKNYSERVFHDLDAGATSWSMIGPKMHPTNLMQAMASFPKIKERSAWEKQNKKDDSNPPQTVCTKWSTCTTEDKCQYEVDTGRQCNRPHFCTFCQKTFNQTRRHKEADCRKKESGSNSSKEQPTS